MLPLNVRGNPVVHEGGRRNIMLHEDYIAAVLCGVLDTQWVSHNMSAVWPGKHKVVVLNQQGVISELSPVLDKKEKKCFVTPCPNLSCLCLLSWFY